MDQCNIYWWAKAATYKRMQTCMILCKCSSKTQETKAREVRVAVTLGGGMSSGARGSFLGCGNVRFRYLHAHTRMHTQSTGVFRFRGGVWERKGLGSVPETQPPGSVLSGSCTHTVGLASVLSASLLCNVSLETHFILIRRETEFISLLFLPSESHWLVSVGTS